MTGKTFTDTEKKLKRVKTRRSMSVHWVACGTCHSKTEGTELGGIELQRSSQFFQVGGCVGHTGLVLACVILLLLLVIKTI